MRPVISPKGASTLFRRVGFFWHGRSLSTLNDAVGVAKAAAIGVAAAAPEAALMRLCLMAFNRGRKYAANQIAEGDVALGETRELLFTELEHLSSSIELMRLAEFKASKTHLEEGIISYQYKEITNAEVSFGHAHKDSVKAFQLCKEDSFEDKLACTKIRLLSFLCRQKVLIDNKRKASGTYSCEEEARGKAYQIAMCQKAFHDLFTCKPVQSALAYNFGKSEVSMFGSVLRSVMTKEVDTMKDCKRILSDVCALRSVIAMELGTATTTFPLKFAGKDVDDMMISQIPCGGYPICFDVSDGKLYVACKNEHVIKVIDLISNKQVAALQGHSMQVNCIVISGSVLCSASDDLTLRFWDRKTNKEIMCQRLVFSVQCLAVSGKRLYSYLEHKVLVCWDVNTCLLLNHQLQTFGQAMSAMTVANGKLYSHRFMDNEVTEWDLDCLVPNSCCPIAYGSVTKITCSAASGNLLCLGLLDNTVRVWDLAKMSEVACLRGHNSSVACLAVANDCLYSVGRDATMKVWNLSDFKETTSIAINACDFNTSSLVASADRLYFAHSKSTSITAKLI